jgi:probable phosphoglycerate mutase
VKLYFARHGESEANANQVFWNHPEQYGLTDKGRAQAADLADRLPSVQFAALLCSPPLRAVQTAQIVGRRLGLTPEIAEGLREWDVAILERKRYSEERWALHDQVTVQWMKHGNHDSRIEGGESHNDVAARFAALIDGLRETYCRTDANVLLISHAGTPTCMLPLLLANVDKAAS